MSRLGRRRSLTLAATALAVLAAPAAAHAANYTVAAGQGACGGADLGCESLTAAAAAVNAGPGGDTIDVGAGTYTESPTFSAPGLTITGSSGPPVVVGTISFTGAGAPSVLQKIAVLVPAGGGAGVSVGSASGGVALRDALVFSATGPGMTIAGGTGNEITRSTVISSGSAANAVDIAVGTAAATLVLDSSIISGGGTGAGVAAKTGAGTLVPGSAGSVTITGRQVTIAGSGQAVALDASAAMGIALGGGVGNIAATFSDSIALGAVNTKRNTGVPLLSPANTVTATFPNTDTTSSPEQLFVNPAKKNFHLRAGAPAIDKVPTASSASATDVDGQPRTNGAASDQGGDEWVAGPPPAAPPTAAPSANDRTPPAIAVKRPTANQRIRKTSRRTRTVTVDGKRVRRTTTTRFKRLAISGTATDPSGVKGVIVTIQKLGTAAGAKCKWYNATKGMVLKSCTKPPLLLARLAADGTWTYSANRQKLSAGSYRIVVLGADNSGAAGNSAARDDAIRRFRLTNR